MNYQVHGNELYHHGILGQKWGVRRYQNYDGSYTRAGLKRYNKSLADYEERKKNYQEHGNELYHHGILGQKWGVRRYQNPDGSLTPAGRERYGYGKTSSKASNKETSSNKAGMDPIVATYLTYVALYATAITAVKLYYNNAKKKITKYNSNEGDIQKKKDREYSKDEDMAVINKEYPHQGATTNCTMCTTAYDLRRRGYDVQAKLDDRLSGRSYDDVASWYKNGKIEAINDNRTFDDIGEKLKKQGDGARGNLLIQYPFGGGHSLIYEIDNGQFVVRDAQDNKTYVDQQAYRYFEQSGFYLYGASFMRTDNLEPNWDKINEAVMERTDVTLNKKK